MFGKGLVVVEANLTAELPICAEIKELVLQQILPLVRVVGYQYVGKNCKHLQPSGDILDLALGCLGLRGVQQMTIYQELQQ